MKFLRQQELLNKNQTYTYSIDKLINQNTQIKDNNSVSRNKLSDKFHIIRYFQLQIKERECSKNQNENSNKNIHLHLVFQKNQTKSIAFFLIAFLSLLSVTKSDIIPSNLKANQFADYRLELFDLSSTIQSGSVVLIAFPRQYSPYDLQKNKPYSGNNIATDSCPGGCSSVIITYSAMRFALNNMYPIPEYPFFTFTIFNIKNPAYKTTTDNFTVQIRTSNYLNILYTTTLSGVKITAQQFQINNVSLTNPYLWQYSDITWDLSVTPDVDYIQIIFPQKWKNQQKVNFAIFSSIMINSSTHAINFSKSEQTINLNIPQIVTTQNLKFTIKSIYMPSSVLDLGPISFLGYNYFGQIIKENSYFIPSSLLKVQFLRQLESQILYNETTNTILIKNQFKPPKNSLINDKILINYPSQITISNSISNYQLFLKDVPTSKGISILNGNILELIPFTGTDFQVLFQVRMTIPWPRTSIQTSNFTISSWRKISTGYSKMQEARCCSLWIKQKPTLVVALNISSNQRLKPSVQYSFDITQTFETLLVSDSIAIQFPAVFEMDVSKQTSVCSTIIPSLASNPSNLNTAFSCSLSSNLLLLANLFKSSQSQALLNIKVSLTNPAKTPNENFQIWSQSSSGLKIQSNGLLAISIIAASIPSISISSSSFYTNRLSNYILTITSIGLVLKNSIIQIKIPPEIRLLRYSLVCQVNSAQQFCSFNQNTFFVMILIGSDLLSTTFQVNLLNLINPETIAATENFHVQIIDPAENIVESSTGLTSGLNIQMTKLDSFLLAKMWTDTTNLDMKGKLKFLIITNNNLSPSSSYRLDIIISPRTAFSLDNLASLQASQDTSSASFTSSNITNQTILSITFTTVQSSNNIFQFQFSEFYPFQDSFTASMFLAKQINKIFYSTISTTSEIVLQQKLNSVLISNYQVTQTGYLMNESPGIIRLKINNISPNISFSSIIIHIPKNYQSASSTYKYTSLTNITIIDFSIPDLLNPIQITKQPFTFLIYDSVNQIVGVSLPSTQYFQTKCAFPCRNCNPINPNQCKDCYSIPSNTKIYFRLNSSLYGECTDSCVQGQYLDANKKQCLACDTNCSSCLISAGLASGDPQKCLTCKNRTFLLNSRCYAQCPDGSYANNLVCSSCSSNCAKCSGLTLCSQCVNPAIYYLGKQFITQVNNLLILGNCLESCPLKTIAKINLINLKTQCFQCQSNCLACTDINICTLCTLSFYLYNSICLKNCPSTPILLYPDLNNQCKTCECLTCVNWSFNCTACSADFIFDSHKFSCLKKCDDGQYNNSGICAPCASNCLICASFDNCQVCKEPQILYRTSGLTSECVTQCPNSTVVTVETSITTSKVLQCLKCQSSCLKCIFTSTFCIQCQSGTIFYNNLCLFSCPLGYHNVSNYCKKCVDECQECDPLNPKNCSECTQGYYLYDKFCYANCPQGNYAQILVKKCLSCQPLCQTCLNSTSCTSCKSGFFLFPDNKCYDSCPTTPIYYYKYNSQCIICQSQCSTCTSSPFACLTCSSVEYYQNQDTKECSTKCAYNYFIKDKMCIKCRAPCDLCDSTYDSCISCLKNSSLLYLYEGMCYSQCPSGYYNDTFANSTITIENKCERCPFPCQTCQKLQCKSCESFAFMYKTTCVLNCEQTIDMPYQKGTYCTNCLSIPFCTFCQTTQVNSLVCWSCTYPYVLFQGQCLNECPFNYQVIDQEARICKQSEKYIIYKQQIYTRNKPVIPFIFITIFLVLIAVLYPISKSFYIYTYHVGYCIFLINFLDYTLIYTWLIRQNEKYQGQFFDGADKIVPLIIIVVALCINLILIGWIGFGYVMKSVYLNDVRYQEWKNNHFYSFVSLLFFLIIFGPRSHKLYYSKIFGLQNFAYRIISVEKFYLQDRINFILCFGDCLILVSFLIVAYNVFIQYSVLYLTAYEIIIIKVIEWMLLIYDSKKPDRGFFYGDEKDAFDEIQKEEQQQLAKLRRVDTDHLIKMIRQKSACLFSYDQQPFGQIQKVQFLSVYNPEDYQDVPIVPLRKISKKINKGTFRKGRKITIQQKLQRFADSIKPKPIFANKGQYLHGLIYWKPPKKIKNVRQIRVQPVSQESMLKILEGKELQYKEELEEIQNIIFEEKSDNDLNFRTGQFFFKDKKKPLNIDYSYKYLEDSNPSIQQLDDLSSQILKPSKQQIEYNDLMNLNYAKKQHLPQESKKLHFDDNEMRILYHQPMKKRASQLKK